MLTTSELDALTMPRRNVSDDERRSIALEAITAYLAVMLPDERLSAFTRSSTEAGFNAGWNACRQAIIEGNRE
jgi:hypothetical protein